MSAAGSRQPSSIRRTRPAGSTTSSISFGRTAAAISAATRRAPSCGASSAGWGCAASRTWPGTTICFAATPTRSASSTRTCSSTSRRSSGTRRRSRNSARRPLRRWSRPSRPTSRCGSGCPAAPPARRRTRWPCCCWRKWPRPGAGARAGVRDRHRRRGAAGRPVRHLPGEHRRRRGRGPPGTVLRRRTRATRSTKCFAARSSSPPRT